MRMNPEAGESAAELLDRLEEGPWRTCCFS
jgi:hypothetical protein